MSEQSIVTIIAALIAFAGTIAAAFITRKDGAANDTKRAPASKSQRPPMRLAARVWVVGIYGFAGWMGMTALLYMGEQRPFPAMMALIAGLLFGAIAHYLNERLFSQRDR